MPRSSLSTQDSVALGRDPVQVQRNVSSICWVWFGKPAHLCRTESPVHRQRVTGGDHPSPVRTSPSSGSRHPPGQVTSTSCGELLGAAELPLGPRTLPFERAAFGKEVFLLPHPPPSSLVSALLLNVNAQSTFLTAVGGVSSSRTSIFVLNATSFLTQRTGF